MTDSLSLARFALKEKERFKLKIGVFLFLIQDEHLLLLRRYCTGIGDGMYVLPMGGHDGKEPLTQALIREVKEETNILIKPEQITACHVMHRLHHLPDGLSFEQMDVFFKATTYEGIIKNREPHKCDELQFYPLNDLPANTVPFIRYAIDCILKQQIFSEFGWSNET